MALSSCTRRTSSPTSRSAPLPLPPDAAPALRLGAALDLPHALPRQAEDLADVAERQLVVLQHPIAQLHDRLLLQRQLVDRLLHQRVLADVLEIRQPVLRQVGAHPLVP